MAIKTLEKESKREHIENSGRLEAAKAELLGAVEALNNQLQGISGSVEIVKQANAWAAQRVEASLSRLACKIDLLHLTCESVATSNKILASLLFPQIGQRQDAVPDAYTDTYTWIFDPEVTTFRNWLEDPPAASPHNVFWINGKAGSGKSTLIKFIEGHPMTQGALEKWAGGDRLVLASFYFWNAGTQLQRSQEGLLQTLLFQILRSCPEVVPKVCPKRWQGDAFFHEHPPQWKRMELLEAIDSALLEVQATAQTRFCFFIDGLDEFEDRDKDPYSLIPTVRRLSSCPAVKVCLSSRPWRVFQDEFRELGNQQIALHDLTQSDIQNFIYGMLVEDDRFQRRLTEESNIEKIVQGIEWRADGVFLWVFLTVRSLLRGLSAGDDIAKLEERLSLLPSDLKQYFTQMLAGIDEAYQTEAARVLLIAATAPTPVSVEPLYFIDADRKDENFLFGTSLGPVDFTLQKKWRKVSRDRINSWCKELLEIRYGKLQFLHRTVYDFLEDPDVRELIQKQAGHEFRARFALCKLYVAWFKIMDPKTAFERTSTPIDDDGLVSFDERVFGAMFAARLIELYHGMTLEPVLDELDTACSRLWLLHKQGMTYQHSDSEAIPAAVAVSAHWTEHCLMDQDSRKVFRSTFLTFATHYKLALYLQCKISQMSQEMVQEIGSDIVVCASEVHYKYDAFSGDYEDSRREIFKLLEDRGYGVRGAQSKIRSWTEMDEDEVP